MTDIVRIETNQRMSRVVKAAGLAFIGGQTSADHAPDVKVQTAKVLEKIDGFLEKAGIDKTRLVSAQVWLADIARDFGFAHAPESDPARIPVEPTRRLRLSLARQIVHGNIRLPARSSSEACINATGNLHGRRRQRLQRPAPALAE